MTQYVVFDDKGIIYQSNDQDEAAYEWEQCTDFTGDLRLAQVLEVRR